MHRLVMEQLRMAFWDKPSLTISDDRLSALHDYFANAMFKHIGHPIPVSTEAEHVTGNVFHVTAVGDGIEWAALGVCATPNELSHQPYLEILHRADQGHHAFVRCNRTVASPTGDVLWALAFLHRGPNINHWPNHLLRAYHTQQSKRPIWQYFFCVPGHKPAVLSERDVHWIFDPHEEYRLQ